MKICIAQLRRFLGHLESQPGVDVQLGYDAHMGLMWLSSRVGGISVRCSYGVPTDDELAEIRDGASLRIESSTLRAFTDRMPREAYVEVQLGADRVDDWGTRVADLVLLGTDADGEDYQLELGDICVRETAEAVR